LNNLINFQAEWMQMLIPELIVVITALLVLFTDLTLIRRKARSPL
jgi:hypothetical protein